jgi:6-pyruvoyltetrahydropterin/6-carboxytetrahydropterin synthase
MKAYLTRRYSFPASHRLHSAGLTPEQNAATYGKCNNPHGHGHNYCLEVTVAGPVDPRTGMVCDLAALDDFIRRQILDRFDHADLNSLPEFAGRVPTSENLCLEIYGLIQAGFTAARLECVRLQETRKNSFAFGTIRP